MPKAAKKIIGRTSGFSQKVADAICEHVASGVSQRAACRSEGVDESTFRLWRRESEALDTQYARAREDRAHLWAEELVEIADTTEEGRKVTIKPDGSEETVIGDMIEHRKLKIEARKWMMARILRGQYGDRQEIEHTGKITLESLVAGSVDEQ